MNGAGHVIVTGISFKRHKRHKQTIALQKVMCYRPVDEVVRTSNGRDMDNEPELPSVHTTPLGQVGAINPQMLYMNGFKVGHSTTDAFIVIQHNGNDIAVLNFSYTLAKTLGGHWKNSLSN